MLTWGRASPPHPPQAPGRREGAASPHAPPCRHFPHLSRLPTGPDCPDTTATGARRAERRRDRCALG